ncbi:MAG TPA: histidine kinase [Chitinophagaceae bacterium]
MTLHDFIFTNERPAKYYRHIAFWLGQCIFWGFWAAIFFFEPLWEFLNFQLRNKQYFILDISYTYAIAYYFYPRFILGRQRKRFLIPVFIFTAVTYILFILHLFWIHDLINKQRDEQLLMAWFFSMNFIISGPPVVCAMFLTIKMLKNYYIKMHEKIILIQENANAELQLLKAQVHPHFLFNTLNNIYSFSINQSLQAGILVNKLSGMLNYMIHECDEKLVLLEKELKLIEDYMGLEKVRYGKRLNMEVNIHGDFENKLIAPLLMIPFVENCFKHGTSQMLRHPWVKLEITCIADQLFFNLSNSKPSLTAADKLNKGIGLNNVKKRLQLLYPGKHQLDISETENMFMVNMQIMIEENVSGENKIVQSDKALEYA